jgi:hypothetical protein
VRQPGVGLHDHALAGPREVVALGADAVLGLGRREAVAGADRQEVVLQHRLRHRRLGQQVRQRPGRAPGQGVLDRGAVVQAAEHRLAQRADELVAVQQVRQVDQRAGRAGHRDAAVDRPVGVGQDRPMRRDRRVPPVVLGRDLRPEQLTEADAPEGRRAAVTQERPVAAGQDRRQPAGLLPETEMPHRVHAAMHPMQPPRPAPVVDRVLSQPQLPACHHPELTTRQIGQRNIRAHQAAHIAV